MLVSVAEVKGITSFNTFKFFMSIAGLKMPLKMNMIDQG